jgi:hypothetical protein
MTRVKALTQGRKGVQVDWAAVKRAGLERTGLPVWVAEVPAIPGKDTPVAQLAADTPR